jgi:hypothetical protein
VCPQPDRLPRPPFTVAKQGARDAVQRLDLLGAALVADELDLGSLKRRGVRRARLDRGGQVDDANPVTLSIRIAAQRGSDGRPPLLMGSITDAITAAPACR